VFLDQGALAAKLGEAVGHQHERSAVPEFPATQTFAANKSAGLSSGAWKTSELIDPLRR
jgi:hypothetical protein